MVGRHGGTRVVTLQAKWGIRERLVTPTFRTVLAPSIYIIWKLPYRHAQRLASLVILDPVKLFVLLSYFCILSGFNCWLTIMVDAHCEPVAVGLLLAHSTNGDIEVESHDRTRVEPQGPA